jgi:hypothetical protein
MIDFGARARLADETRLVVLGQRIGLDELESHCPRERGVMGPVDDTHTASAQLTLDLETRYDFRHGNRLRNGTTKWQGMVLG